MKFYCDKCNAKYAISDDKVRGKILKVRCKKCSHIITVREPTAPVAAASPSAPVAQKQIAWHYSINGQTFGPFTQSALVQMYTDGAVPEASYVWNESFDGWKPALEIEPFGSALRKRHEVRPPARTMGVSGALQAISIDNHQPPEEEVSGVVPGQESSDDLSGRLDALRGKLQAASPAAATDNPFAKKTDNPFATSQPEVKQDEPVLPEQTEVDQPALSIPKLSAPPSLFDEPVAQEPETPDPTPSPEDSLSAPLTSDSLFDEPDEPEAQDDPFALGAPTPEAQPEPGLSFGNDLGVDEGAIDFSSINASPNMQESQLVLGEDEKSEFVASNSLLIQLDEIKKQGRSKRMAFRAIGAVLLLCIIGGGGFMWWQNRQVKKSVNTTLAKAEQDSHKGELVIPTYKKLELMTFGEEEVIKISDTKEDFEEDQKPSNTQTDTKTDSKPNKTKPVMLAKNTKTRPKSIDKTKKSPSLGINVNDLTRGSNSGLGNALNTSKTKKSTAKGGLKTTKDGAKASDAKVEPGKRNTNNLALSLMGQGRRTKTSQIYKPTAVNTKPAESNAPPSGTLTKVELKKGFQRIRKSVGSCYQRHVRRGLPFDSPKIKVNVEILNTGRVSRVFFKPSNLANTEFGRCMNQRKQTWSFRAYTGGPLKVGHTYVLQ